MKNRHVRNNSKREIGITVGIKGYEHVKNNSTWYKRGTGIQRLGPGLNQNNISQI